MSLDNQKKRRRGKTARDGVEGCSREEGEFCLMAFPRRCRAKNTHPHGKWQIIYAHTGNMMLRHISVRERKAEKPRLFVRHTRIHAGSGHSVKAKPCRAASRALTFMP